MLDADGLWYLTKSCQQKVEEILCERSKQIILTPNAIEFERVWQSFFPNEKILSREEKKL